MLWTSDVVKDPWFPLVKDPSEVCPSVLLPPKSIYGKSRDDFETVLWTSTSTWVIGLAMLHG